MTKQQLEKTKKAILDRIDTLDNFAILVSDPDADAIGSGLAMEEILEQKGKKVQLYSSFEIPEYSFLPRSEKFVIKNTADLDFGQFQCLIFLDSSDPTRTLDKIGEQNIRIPKDVFVINIDHHNTSTMFGHLNYVVPRSTSTGELLFDIFGEHIQLTPSIATNLLCAIIGDTNCFKYPTYNYSHTFEVASILIQNGARHDFIVRNSFYSNTKNVIDMNIEALKNISYNKVGDITFTATVVDLKKYGITTSSSRRSFYNYYEIVQSIEGIDFSVRINPLTQGFLKISFRGRTTVVNSIAEHFGGGGHKAAAGGIIKSTPEKFISDLKNYLENAQLEKL
ncbi:MAG: DHH family phosphoesterase [Candidatus Dojkabacteria bacterium]|nr:DHH family phosphoesterase [Candidatus Dojkabacteria bacterium]